MGPNDRIPDLTETSDRYFDEEDEGRDNSEQKYEEDREDERG